LFKKADKKKNELLYVNSRKKPWLELANEPEFRPYIDVLVKTAEEYRNHKKIKVNF